MDIWQADAMFSRRQLFGDDLHAAAVEWHACAVVLRIDRDRLAGQVQRLRDENQHLRDQCRLESPCEKWGRANFTQFKFCESFDQAESIGTRWQGL